MIARIGPIKRHDLIRSLRRLGFDGPFPGGRHEFMTCDDARAIIPNPHRGEIGPKLLERILRDAGVSRIEWEEL